MKKPTSIPFNFVLEQLYSVDPILKPMFGCHAVYIGDKIMVILRQKEDHREDNGIWLSTKKEHHTSLRILFPAMRSIQVLGNGETHWQILPEESEDFEQSAISLCELITKGDARIGNVPKRKKKKEKKR